MKKITGKEQISTSLISLFLFSMFLPGEIPLAINELLNSALPIPSPKEPFDIMMYGFLALYMLYLWYKNDALVLRITYLLASIAFLIDMIEINCFFVKYSNCIKSVIHFVVVINLLKYIDRSFEMYRSQWIKMMARQKVFAL